MSEHTPGPWAAIPSGEAGQERAWFVHRVGDAKPIAKIAWYAMPKAESDANARLIAAAPDLLDVLQQVKEQAYRVPNRGGDVGLPLGAWELVLSVLEKATPPTHTPGGEAARV